MRILLASAYDAESHRYWRQALVSHFPKHYWTIITLPPRHFAWRIRGNALSWAFEQREALDQDYDLIIATSMVDLATLKGLTPGLSHVRSLLYFHENQFAYPETEHVHASVEAQLTSIYSALAADCIVFNSVWNRDSFLQGVATFLKRLPDHVPAHVPEYLLQRSHILPVPLHDDCFETHAKQDNEILTLVWNHRREYDKGPDRLLKVITYLHNDGLDFRIHILGQQFRHEPDAFAIIKEQFAAHLGVWGYLPDRQAYLQLLRQCDIVLSTALHDFQGLAMLEAVACGCIAVAPHRLAYPEFLSHTYLASSFPNDIDSDARALADAVVHAALAMKKQSTERPDMSHFNWSTMHDQYAKLIEQH
ncbi:DUF3524 domain-containing protein [Mariprofundus sp. EBB-1]|uniref:tRNA-queuosine alpha-mannosyltransferase domain-containing protein n=1 Tax=Mariprofundus sp. EBB-1 TaxID=2650971 RepID=UPI000EF1D3F2|nr:DUF3524 domain-containing protein [Mariprofundus sp. EBB-1]RLL51257.1 DUF3524 domain-containing protein [Mariprofundus sp. EBB-1]